MLYIRLRKPVLNKKKASPFYKGVLNKFTKSNVLALYELLLTDVFNIDPRLHIYYKTAFDQ